MVYKTYQEAVIAEGQDLVFTDGCAFFPLGYGGRRCKPSNYCMTVKEFLGKGLRFEDGDCYLDKFGAVEVIGLDIDAESANCRHSADEYQYVINSAALERLKFEPLFIVKDRLGDGRIVYWGKLSEQYCLSRKWARRFTRKELGARPDKERILKGQAVLIPVMQGHRDGR